MDVDDLVASARRELSPVLACSGSVLYSAASTLRPGQLYILGLNPGGDPTKHHTIGETLDSLPTRTRNAYLDETWEGRKNDGEATLQRRVQWLISGLGLDIRQVCASNLIFVRSRDATSSGFPELADVCWPVHEMILEIVQPKLIIAYGNSSISPYTYVREKLSSSTEEQFASGHGEWACRVFRTDGGHVVGLPHLSRYAVNRHPEVLARLGKLLEAHSGL